MPNESDIASVVRAYFESYPARDRAAIERLVSADFHFTSPLDNRIGRETYFERCWPTGEMIAAIDLKHVVVDGERVFVTYEATMKDELRMRNTELLTVRAGQVCDVEVYFGWNIPHEAPAGGFVDKPGGNA